MDKISVVTVTYNCEEVIEETLNSIINQSYDNIEYIIIDGKSQDHTLEIINKYSDKIDILISEKDSGIFDAMNKAIKNATGDWIIFMNAGDRFADNDVLRKVFDNKKYEDNTAVVYGDVIYKGNDHITKQTTPFYKNPKRIKQMGICHQTIFTRTNIARNHLFNIHLKYAADYNMMVAIANQGFDFIHVPVAIAVYDCGGVSSNNPFGQLEEIAEILHASHSVAYYIEKLNIMKRIIKQKIKNLL